MILTIFTWFHVAISLVAIAAGFPMAASLASSRTLNGWNAVFLIMTLATTLTGFLFPIHSFTPAIGVGLFSLLPLGIALFARYRRRLTAPWRPVYVLSAMFAFFLNFFVLIAQSFQKIPPLRALAPTPSARPFVVAQSLTLALLIAFTAFALQRGARQPARLSSMGV